MSAMGTFADVQERFAEFFGRAAALYNINPLLGRLYGYLFLAPEPLTLDDLSRTAGAAKSTVSVAMRELEHYRLIRRQWQKGNRKDFFVVRTDANDVLGELFQLFFSPELKYVTDANTVARTALKSASEAHDWPDAEKRQVLLERLDILDNISSIVSQLLQQFIAKPLQPVNRVQTIEIEVEE